MLIKVDGREVVVEPGMSVAAALVANQVSNFRPLCGMGICFQCRVRIDGEQHVKSCQATVKNGMEVET